MCAVRAIGARSLREAFPNGRHGVVDELLLPPDGSPGEIAAASLA
jgi:hypothetical protein